MYSVEKDALLISEVPIWKISRYSSALCPPRCEVGAQFAITVLVPVTSCVFMRLRIGLHALHLALGRGLAEVNFSTPKASRGRVGDQNMGA